MTKLQIGIISTIVVGGIATPLIIISQLELQRARIVLNRQNADLLKQRAETERLSNLLAQATAAQPGTSARETELLRLRGEIGNLRRQTNDLAKFQIENERLRSGKTADNSISSPSSISRESWAFAGYDDPESALQSAIWAMSKGDARTFLASLSPNGSEYQEAQTKSEQELAEEKKGEIARVTAYKVIEKQSLSDNEVILTVYATGENATARFKLQRVGIEWKVDGPVKDDAEVK